MNTGVDPANFSYAVAQVNNGFVFEDFASRFLSAVLGYEFVPCGDIKDRGIDGLEHTFRRKGTERTIYQMSIEKDPESKIRKSLFTLRDNKINFARFIYVTNQRVKNQDTLIDSLYEERRKPVTIYDINWLAAHVNDNQATINAYRTFVETYLHEFTQPGKSYVVGDLIKDPRLYVFLRQQWEHDEQLEHTDQLLTDSLILFALEGTDPQKGKLLTREQIRQRIAENVKFDPKVLDDIIDRRLRALSGRPRRIQHHAKQDAYCLPYETRLEIQGRNFDDAELHEKFKSDTIALLEKHLSNIGIRVADCLKLIEQTINTIFFQQGLEFADFILKGENKDVFERDLSETVSSTVERSSVIPKNREAVKSALLTTIRDIAYNGTEAQKKFLQRLSNTYLMLFLLQCDPKLGIFFGSLASRLNVYVCTSLIIPAMSEYYLEPRNKRHWNLLRGASDAGVTLIVNEAIMQELVAHFRMIMNRYEEVYKPDEDVYLSREENVLYIEEIMIRAYFYARYRRQVSRFREFIDNFVSPDLKDANGELLTWLREEFGIIYRSDESMGVTIDQEEHERLSEALSRTKQSEVSARIDAKLILTIYAIRRKNNEEGSRNIFGYRTWWLSKDTLTMKATNEVFKHKYGVSCYIRPDFLYNYISLSPKLGQIRESYSKIFPSLLGVNLSYHLAPDIIECVHKCLAEHRSKNQARKVAILQRLTQRLRVDPNARSRAQVKHFLDSELQRLEKG